MKMNGRTWLTCVFEMLRLWKVFSVHMFSFSAAKMGLMPLDVMDVCERLRDVIPWDRNLIIVANSAPTLSSILQRQEIRNTHLKKAQNRTLFRRSPGSSETGCGSQRVPLQIASKSRFSAVQWHEKGRAQRASTSCASVRQVRLRLQQSALRKMKS